MNPSLAKTRIAPRLRGLCAAAALLGAAVAAPASAKPPLKIELTLQGHRFSPSTIQVPSGTPVELSIRNLDPMPEEFDSTALKIEQVIPGGMSATVRLRPLAPGRFPFMGEYHADTAQGVVISR